MKYLSIVRHAKSSWDDHELPDLVRPLNDRGRNTLPVLQEIFSEYNIVPDLIYTSPATRALHTAIALAKANGMASSKLAIRQEIYFGTTQQLLKLLQHTDAVFSDVVIVGHEPLLSGFIELLTGFLPEKFPTGGTYRISFAVSEWNKIQAGSGKSEFWVNPKNRTEKK